MCSRFSGDLDHRLHFQSVDSTIRNQKVREDRQWRHTRICLPHLLNTRFDARYGLTTT